jgi:hypothetical protein
MKLKGAWSFYDDRIKKGTPHVVHFRITTSGGTCEELTHPFVVAKNTGIELTYSGKKPVLFHNGCLSGWQADFISLIGTEKIRVTDTKWSDTRYAALLAAYRGIEILGKLSGKFAVVKPDVINYWGDFTKVGDLLFSNSFYEDCRWSKHIDWNQSFGSYYSYESFTPKSDVSERKLFNDQHTNGVHDSELSRICGGKDSDSYKEYLRLNAQDDFWRT